MSKLNNPAIEAIAKEIAEKYFTTTWRGAFLAYSSKLTDEILADRNATIERCAQVAESYDGYISAPNPKTLAAAIRALKEKR